MIKLWNQLPADVLSSTIIFDLFKHWIYIVNSMIQTSTDLNFLLSRQYGPALNRNSSLVFNFWHKKRNTRIKTIAALLIDRWIISKEHYNINTPRGIYCPSVQSWDVFKESIFFNNTKYHDKPIKNIQWKKRKIFSWSVFSCLPGP